MSDPTDEWAHPVDTPLEHAFVIGAELMRRRAGEVAGESPGFAAQLTDLAEMLDHHLGVVRGCRELGNGIAFGPEGQVHLVELRRE